LSGHALTSHEDDTVGIGSGVPTAGQIGLAKGLPISMNIWIVEDKIVPSTPRSFSLMIFSATEKAEFITVVTISKMAFVRVPGALPHIASDSAG